MTNVGHRRRPQLRARQSEARLDRSERAPLAEGPRARDPQGAEADPGDRACARLRPADLVQPAGARSGNAVASGADLRRPRGEGSGYRRPRNLRQGGQSRAFDQAQPRCRGRPGDHGPAGRRHDPPAAGRRHRQLLARPRRPELRGQRPAVEASPAGRFGHRQPLPDDATAAGPTGDARMVPLRQVADIVAIDEPADHQARGPAAAHRRSTPTPRDGLRATSAPTCRRSSRTRCSCRPATGFTVGGQQQDMQDAFKARAGRARARGDLHLPDPRLAVRELHPAAGDHGLAAVLADRRVPRAARHRHDAQPLLDHRLHHADGARHQERDPAGRFRQPVAPSGVRPSPTRCWRPGRCGCARS